MAPHRAENDDLAPITRWRSSIVVEMAPRGAETTSFGPARGKGARIPSILAHQGGSATRPTTRAADIRTWSILAPDGNIRLRCGVGCAGNGAAGYEPRLAWRA